MKNLMIALHIPFLLWLIGCSLISFVSWHNYFIYTIDQWDSVARFFFIILSLVGIGIHVLNKRNYKL
jgi:hypothetical protein